MVKRKTNTNSDPKTLHRIRIPLIKKPRVNPGAPEAWPLSVPVVVPIMLKPSHMYRVVVYMVFLLYMLCA